VLEASGTEILERLPDDATVLDVGGWGQPFPRADWVLDLLPYETRGLYGYDRATAVERFTAQTWVQRDICDHEAWPFADRQFDFAVCSHTLEDVRDPIWVCHELQRVAKAGYIECPSRAEEQSWGVHGPWVGWSHHRWLVDVVDGRLRFAFKPAVLHARDHFPAGHAASLSATDRVVVLWWEGGFAFEELQFVEPEDLHRYLRSVDGQPAPPADEATPATSPSRGRGALRRVRSYVRPAEPPS
jgi:hypothetical protein